MKQSQKLLLTWLIEDTRLLTASRMDHGGRFHGTAVSQSGTGAVHPVWGERTGESGKDYQPVSGGGRTKRNCGAF